ncbi:MAG: hypothetical protein AB7O78_05555 [Thermoleophilia bacterium]
MTTLAHPVPAVRAATEGDAVRALARQEIRRYARHPLFLFGLAATIGITATGPDPDTSSMFHAIVPAAAIGLLGIVVMWLLARRSDAAVRVAGAPPVGERTRTLALACAAVVPFLAGLAWFAWAMVTYEVHPPTFDGFPFGEADNAGWVAAVLFAMGPLACVGGPVLGLLVARWTTGRAAPAVTVIVVVAATIVMQGIFEPLRRPRVIMPWTYWGGPSDIGSERMLVLPGNPYWWVLYVAVLSAGGVVLALLHDRERPRGPLVRLAGVLAAVAVVTCLLAMWTGIPDQLVNPYDPVL